MGLKSTRVAKGEYVAVLSVYESDFAHRVGRELREARRSRKLRLRQIANGRFSVATLRAAERGQLDLDRPMLTELASRYGIDLGELFPSRQSLGIGANSVTIGDIGERCDLRSLNSTLTAYLSVIEQTRSATGGNTGPLRRDDIQRLADHLDVPCTTIISRLADLVDAEGSETRAMIDLYLSGASIVGLRARTNPNVARI